MKKSSKVMLLTAAVVGVVGIGMSIGGVAMGATITGLNLSKYGFSEAIKQTTKYVSLDDKDDWEQDWDEIMQLKPVKTDTDKEMFETAPTSDLEFSLSGDELEFQSYDGDKIRIEVSGSKKDKVKIGTEDDCLILETTGRIQDRKITVSYPKGLRFKETSIDVAAGTVTMSDEFRTDDLDVSVGAGEFTNTGKISVANDTTITVGTGNVELSELDICDLEVKCGIGNVDLDVLGKEADYNYAISCAAGNVDIGDSSYSGLGHERDISNPGASDRMNLDCGVGNITVNFEK
ncbi:DUF4097 family beta strand repeat-containing protein [Blautia sp. MSJ-19]|uniref:DUF4097 family beta strand repeat-containing protein n=1 Tax=Blautia sp. MSJ-19 TaxID=2841517 RepID=UPI001C0F257C|nr:DUF4097 family beta strand repeat-containing protein [Blautia sp. MSJ-19]MBU5481183.1 DUF4097 family beta strand repeat protein [Blautia sp. MSJ-19]